MTLRAASVRLAAETIRQALGTRHLSATALQASRLARCPLLIDNLALGPSIRLAMMDARTGALW